MNRHRLIFAVAFLAGCESATPSKEAFFEPEDHPRLTRTMMEVQVARGARVDGTLYPAHFDGDALNSLGRDKLNWMLRDNDAPLPLVVYISDSGAAAFTPRHDAVRQHLLDAGLTAQQFRTMAGANPATSHPVAGDLTRLSKTESGEGASAPEAASDPAALLGNLTAK